MPITDLQPVNDFFDRLHFVPQWVAHYPRNSAGAFLISCSESASIEQNKTDREKH